MVEISKKDKVYSKGYIYLIYEQQTHFNYVGSTHNLKKRWKSHKCSFKNVNSEGYNKLLYVSLRENNKNIVDCSYDIIEEHENITIRELEKIENDYIIKYKNLNNLNCNKYRTQRTDKQYYEDNKEKIKKYRNERKICELCKFEYTQVNFARHNKSKKHLEVLTKQKDI